MAVEIEAKMRVQDRDQLVARLSIAGAKEQARWTEVNSYFDTPHRTLRSTDQGLRLRVERQTDGRDCVAILTHKGPRAAGDLKQRAETEVVVSNAHAAADLLTALGYVLTRSFEKRRHRWELGGCHVDMDTLPYLGDFVEIEGPSKEVILAVRHDLGLDAQPLVNDSYIAMLEAYVMQHQIHDPHIGFDRPDAC